MPTVLGSTKKVSGRFFDKGAMGFHVEHPEFAAVGDGTTNDYAALQATIDAASLVNGDVYLRPGANYRCVITSGGLVLKTGVTLWMNGATISFECNGAVYGLRLLSNTRIEGPGTLAVTESEDSGSQAIYHSPISIGAAYGENGTPAAPSIYEGVNNIRVRGISLSSVREIASAFAVMGGAYNVTLEQITVPDSSTLAYGFSADWGTLGEIASNDVVGSRTIFDAGTGYTTHPHHFVLRDWKIGALTYSTTYGVRLSGVHDFLIENIDVDSTTFSGFFHTAGDLGYEFAPVAVKPFRHRNVIVKKFTVHDANNSWGAYMDCWADNITAAISGSGYSPLIPAVSEYNLVLEDFFTMSDGGASVIDGIRVLQAIGTTLKNCTAIGHLQGILIDEGADNTKIIGGIAIENRNHGLHIHHATDRPQNTLVDGFRAHSNGTAVASSAGIKVENADITIIQNSKLGLASDPTQDFGVRVESTSTKVSLLSNHVFGLAASGVALSCASGGTYDVSGVPILWEVRGNTVAAGTTFFAGIEIVPQERIINDGGTAIGMFRCQRGAMTGETTPAAGTWAKGDFIRYTDPAASGFIGTICTTAGVIGSGAVFKTVGPISA